MTFSLYAKELRLNYTHTQIPLNTLHTTIKFIFESYTTELFFLDTTVYIGLDFNTTKKVNIKQNTHQINKQTNKLYIHGKSYHPPSCKKAITKGETLRYLRTNTRKDTFSQMTKQLRSKMIQRGYKAKDVKTTTNLIHFKDRQSLNQP